MVKIFVRVSKNSCLQFVTNAIVIYIETIYNYGMGLSNQQVEFCKKYAECGEAIKAAIEAGYSETTAKAKSYKWLVDGRFIKEIDYWKAKAQKKLEKEFDYTIEESFKKLCEIQAIALQPDAKGNFPNLATAAKVEELKGKLYGAYSKDNEQKNTNTNVIINREAVQVESLN